MGSTAGLTVLQFFQEDIVRRKDDPKAYGVVLVSPPTAVHGGVDVNEVWVLSEVLARC